MGLRDVHRRTSPIVPASHANRARQRRRRHSCCGRRSSARVREPSAPALPSRGESPGDRVPDAPSSSAARVCGRQPRCSHASGANGCASGSGVGVALSLEAKREGSVETFSSTFESSARRDLAGRGARKRAWGMPLLERQPVSSWSARRGALSCTQLPVALKTVVPRLWVSLWL